MSMFRVGCYLVCFLLADEDILSHIERYKVCLAYRIMNCCRNIIIKISILVVINMLCTCIMTSYCVIK